jgi:hypothetical protein
MAISYILWPFGIGCWSFWDSLPVFGALYQEKSGNPTASRRPPSLLVFKADFQALGGILLFPLLRSAQYSVRNLSRARESKKNRRGRSGGKTCRMHAHGDQMRLRKFANKSSKNRQKIAKSGQKSRKKVAKKSPIPFLSVLSHIFTMEICIPQICYIDTSAIFKKLPLVNNRPLGENSPNLVTLVLQMMQKRRSC